MSTPDADGWLREVETYLELGSGGVVVLVDGAHKARLGELSRHLLRRHPDLWIATTAAELREAPKGSHVLLEARYRGVEALNLARSVLKERALRVALWSARPVTEKLSVSAPDFYDWISHRVECPPGDVPRFVSLGLRAAEAAGRPVSWAGSINTLHRAVAATWPERPFRERLIDPSVDYDEIVEALETGKNEFVALTVDRRSRLRLRWALAETRRRARVAIRSATRTPLSLAGSWRVQARTSSLLAAASQPERRMLLAMDLELGVESLVARAGEGALEACLESEDPAVLLARRSPGGPDSWAAMATGIGPLGWELRAFGMDPRAVAALRTSVSDDAWRALAILEPERLLETPLAEPIPPNVWVECQLWRDAERPWSEMAAIAAHAGHHDVAVRWERFAGSDSLTLSHRVELSLVGRSFEKRRQLLQRTADSREGASEALWWRALDAHVRGEAGYVVELREAVASLGASFDPAFAAFAHVVLGDWKTAREEIVAAVERGGASRPLARDALGFAAWACDAGDLVLEELFSEVIDPEDASDPEMSFARWIPVLARHGLVGEERQHRDAGLQQVYDELAAALVEAGRGDHVHAERFAADGLTALQRAVSPREHYLEGVLLLLRARALAHLAQPARARDLLRLAASIVRRTTASPDHPWALMADLDRARLDAVHSQGPAEDVKAAVQALEAKLWPLHAEVRRAMDRSVPA